MNKPSTDLIKSNNLYFLPLLFLIFYSTNVYSQIGLGTQATLNHPGLLKSENDINFKLGTGYGFFVQHDVYDSSSINIDFRYNAVVMKHDADLPKGEKAKYDFSNFSIEAVIKFSNSTQSSFYTGVGVGLLSLISKDRIRKTYSDQTIYPTVFGGWAYNWAEGFDLFVELKAGYGESKAGPEIIPVTGLALNLGLTMYITE